MSQERSQCSAGVFARTVLAAARIFQQEYYIKFNLHWVAGGPLTSANRRSLLWLASVLPFFQTHPYIHDFYPQWITPELGTTVRLIQGHVWPTVTDRLIQLCCQACTTHVAANAVQLQIQYVFTSKIWMWSMLSNVCSSHICFIHWYSRQMFLPSGCQPDSVNFSKLNNALGRCCTDGWVHTVKPNLQAGSSNNRLGNIARTWRAFLVLLDYSIHVTLQASTFRVS